MASYALYNIFVGVIAVIFFFITGGFSAPINLKTLGYAALYAIISLIALAVGLVAQLAGLGLVAGGGGPVVRQLIALRLIANGAGLRFVAGCRIPRMTQCRNLLRTGQRGVAHGAHLACGVALNLAGRVCGRYVFLNVAVGGNGGLCYDDLAAVSTVLALGEAGFGTGSGHGGIHRHVFVFTAAGGYRQHHHDCQCHNEPFVHTLHTNYLFPLY